MNKMMIALAGSALATGLVTTSIVAPAAAEAAGPFDKIKKGMKKVKKKKQEVDQVADTVDAVVSGSARSGGPNTISGIRAEREARLRPSSRYKGHKGKAGPAPAKYVQQLNCANLGLGNAFVAEGGTYTFSQGLNTEERSGLINRQPLKPGNGCLFPAMGVGDVLYVELDKAKYESNKYDYDLQCVSYDGSEQLDRGTRPPADGYNGKDVMLHTGHSLGYTPTAAGSNSSRSGAYEKYLDGRGRSMLTFHMPSLHTDPGTDFFCQHYNKDTGQIALAFTFRRGPGS
ncbi:MAG: hypothetical protein AAF250_08495 [Pseudomonadota bacterium]